METERKSGISQFVHSHKRMVIAIILLLIAAIVITVCVIITNHNKEQAVREYLEDTILIDQTDYYSGEWYIYSFKSNKVAVEHWSNEETAPQGDLNDYTEYDVSVAGDWITVKYASGHLTLKWTDRGTLMEPSYDRLSTYRPDEIDIDFERKNFFCEHNFITTIIKQATCTTSGEEHRICKNCSLEETIYPAPKHTYENHKCTKCGKLEKSDLRANTWYTHFTVTVLQYQNCEIVSAHISRNSVMATYYRVCSHCHAIDGWLQISEPKLGYQASSMFTCDECGKITTVKLKVE